MAITHAHVVVSPTVEMDDATLLFQDGWIIGVGKGIAIPPEAVIFDADGKYIYPSFIELNSDYGMPEISPRKSTPAPEFVSPNNGSTYWNDAIHPQLEASSLFSPDQKKAEELQKMGFGMVLTHQKNGIMRGNAALVSLSQKAEKSVLVRSSAAAFYGFGKGNSSQVYPTSLMGSIALFRQAQYDADWYSKSPKNPVNLSLESILKNRELPQLFDAGDYPSVLRVARLGEEFSIPFIAIGGGNEYQRLEEIKAANIRLILPLDFPKAFDVSDPLNASYLSLAQMKHWEFAPANPAFLQEKDIEFALSSSKNPKEFWTNLYQAIEYGLTPEKALDALTRVPARYLGMENEMGTLEQGKRANFIIADHDVFTEKGKILENWVDGDRYVFTNAFANIPSGTYEWNLHGKFYSLVIEQTLKGLTVKTSFAAEKDFQKGKIAVENDLITFSFDSGTADIPGPIRCSGKINYGSKILDGKALDVSGNWMQWTAIRQKEQVVEQSILTPGSKKVQGKITYPFMAFGDTALPKQENYFFKNVTIWTSDSIGNLKGGVLVSNGKIEAVGKYVSNPGSYIEIDGTNLHLTPGLIDEHSHIALTRGVNESGQNNSAEVRLGDVVNSNDINIYRQLAGGVTSSQLLHGSANPIGGQSQIIKLRWGANSEQLKFENAPKFIKFALGENVTQSNSSGRNAVRFPQTRMGVEQVYLDAFSRAANYDKNKRGYAESTRREKKQGLEIPRRDLELETLVEILNNERYITCHSYIKSEISMLMNVADSMNFRVNTFTHILEGYKVANELHQHGAAASTFSDWWAYKFEVNDAIPYNAAILHQQGVLVAINSDDAEMGRRLNQEAAKIVKYGGVSEIEALKMVTINPAKMLHIDDRVGSITEGKDADLVLWSEYPLSVYTHPVMVLVDGAAYYSEERNAYLMKRNTEETQRLVQELWKAQKKGAKTQTASREEHQEYHCDSYDDEMDF
jgi:imidazolonepropionase-like amidohydrolase